MPCQHSLKLSAFKKLGGIGGLKECKNLHKDKRDRSGGYYCKLNFKNFLSVEEKLHHEEQKRAEKKNDHWYWKDSLI